MTSTDNALLGSLSLPLRTEILTLARPCRLAVGTVLLYRDLAPRNHVFLTSGLASLSVGMSDGTCGDVRTLGRESMTGLSTLLGPAVGNAECVVRMECEGFKVPRQHLASLFQTSSEFRESILRLAQTEMNVSAQNSVCNLRHRASSRVARWLLTASDHLDSTFIAVKQDELAEMLGLRRTTVSSVLMPLFESGFLRKRRGAIQLMDREGLRASACECYTICHAWTYPEDRKDLSAKPATEEPHGGIRNQPIADEALIEHGVEADRRQWGSVPDQMMPAR